MISLKLNAMSSREIIGIQSPNMQRTEIRSTHIGGEEAFQKKRWTT